MRQVGRRDVGDHLSQLSLESFWTHSFVVSVTPFIKIIIIIIKSYKSGSNTRDPGKKTVSNRILKDKLQKGRITHCSKKLWTKAICCE